MLGLYWFALVVGGGVLAVSLLGDLFGDLFGGAHDADLGGGGDVGLGVEHELELGAGHDVEVGGHDVEHEVEAVQGHGGEAHPIRILSLRTITYFLFGFGAVGVLLNFGWHGERPFSTLLASLGVGAVTAAASVLIFGWLRSTEAGTHEDETSFVGLPARVILPLGPGHSGRILVRRGIREYELSARPFETEESDSRVWKDVIIVDMREGTALVAPFDEEV